MRKKMITPMEFAERVGRPYQTVMYWLRKNLVPGVEVIQESRGPVYSVPESQVERFKKQGPIRGRPPKQKGNVKDRAGSKRKGAIENAR
jgi:hypothetical protein